MTLVEKIRSRARANPQRIVLPEGEDPRVITAAAAVTREGFAKITLLGRKQNHRSGGGGFAFAAWGHCD